MRDDTPGRSKKGEVVKAGRGAQRRVGWLKRGELVKASRGSEQKAGRGGQIRGRCGQRRGAWSKSKTSGG